MSECRNEKPFSSDPKKEIETLQPELVFGLVGPLGSNIEAAQEALESELKKVGYFSVLIHLTSDVEELISEIKAEDVKTYKHKMDLMNDIVGYSEKADFLARTAVALIATNRIKINKRERNFEGEQAQEYQAPKTAYIIRQLKRQQEVTTLSKIYGKKFVQVSVAVSEEEQRLAVQSIVARERPELSQADRENEARKLIARDRDEAGVDYGQGLIDVYHSGDVFIGGTANEISAQVSRFIEAFFGSNSISPSKDEFGGYLAKTASLRTLDLSRQVGAALMTEDGDVITLGCNEVPKPLGGNYWCDDENPQRDIERGVEPNKLETTRLIHNFVHALSKLDTLQFDPVDVLKSPELSDVLKDAFVSDITEFGRITHAEMSALADAARLGRSTAGSTIYVTTFPCHNCAKHLIAAGVKRIVYIEPYTKSKAFELSGDALTLSKGDSTKVLVEHFVGISPRRYRDIFEKPKKRRDGRNQVKRWQFDVPTPMVPDKTETHIAIEQQILVGFNEILEKISEGLRAAKSENS
jgi:deoxycytidylate deaminase